MPRSVAVVGVGRLGSPVARRLVSAGFEVTVCDSDESAMASLADCAAADVVVVLVATPDQVRDVVLGPDGVMVGRSGPHAPAVVVMSTVAPATVQDLGQRLREQHVPLIDAPVSGGPRRAEDGTLTVMIGGDEVDVEPVRPVLSAVGSRLFPCGPVGAAQLVKLVNNAICAANVVISAEAYHLASRAGMAPTDIAHVLDTGTGRNFLSAGEVTPEAYYALWTEGGRGGFESWRAIIRKDVGLALDLAADSPHQYPALNQLLAMLDSMGEETFGIWQELGSRGTAHR